MAYKVAQKHGSFLVEQNVCWLDVSMQDPMGVQVVQRRRQAQQPVPQNLLWQVAAVGLERLHKALQIPAWHIVHYDVQVLSVDVGRVALDDAFVVERAVQPRLLQRGGHLLRVTQRHNLVAQLNTI